MAVVFTCCTLVAIVVLAVVNASLPLALGGHVFMALTIGTCIIGTAMGLSETIHSGQDRPPKLDETASSDEND